MNNLELKNEAKEVLQQLLNSISILSLDYYTNTNEILNNSSIGEHTRHIIELFQQLLLGHESGNVNYDARQRDYRLQQDINFASDSIANIISNLDKPNKILLIFTICNKQESKIKSNFARELMYNIEHCIHHLAIIKIAFLILKINIEDENFGVAKSTIEFRKQFI